MKEITGSGIFSVYEQNDALETGTRTYRVCVFFRFSKHFLVLFDYVIWSIILCVSGNVQKQAEATVSHISFGEEEIVTPKKPATVPEVAKQRELSGTLQSQSDAKLNKQFSDSKFKELSGHNIFAPPPEIKLRPTVRALAYKDNFDLGQSDTKTVTLSQL